ncbi:MAG: gluconate 2-dehydrogenase subunit 3 family protein [bacterium]
MIDAARSAAAGWLALQLPLLVACARDADGRDPGLAHLTRAEAQTMRAFAAQILPFENGRPGADEAGAVTFVDRALGMPFFAESVPTLRLGLADLDSRAAATGARDGFASIPGNQQIRLMRAIEQTPFFAVARSLVVIGTLADPYHGGNRDHAGWVLLGIDHRPSFSAPFGWYDASTASNSAASAAAGAA